VVEEGGGANFPAGSRVIFAGTYGAFEDGTYREWIAVRKEDLCVQQHRNFLNDFIRICF
jgi:NADPH2:quinone reductase